MTIPIEKRLEYWNHFIEMWALDRNIGPHGLTPAKLRKAKELVMQDDSFWYHVVGRHGGIDKTPYQLELEDKFAYEHCMGNFWGMLRSYIGRTR